MATSEQQRTIRQALSVALPTSVYGVSLGAVAVASGLSVWQACVTSLLLFSGGSQFALVGILGGGGTATSAIAASSLLGVRNALYGLQLNTVMKPRRLWQIPVAQLTIDESSAVAISQSTPALSRLGFWVTGIGIYLGWNLMTLLGALAGNSLGDPRRYGLDAAAAAAFLALLWPRITNRDAVAIALAAGVVCTVLVPVLPVGLPVLAAAVVAIMAGVRRPRFRGTGSPSEGAQR